MHENSLSLFGQSQMHTLNPKLFHKEYLQSGRRLDGRSCDDIRPISMSCNCIEEFASSSLVSLGKTIVVTAISIKPQPLLSSLTIAVQRAAVSSQKGKTPVDKALTSMMASISSKILSLDDLEIMRPNSDDLFPAAVKVWCWNINVIQTIISDDGAVEIATIIGFEEAMREMKLPLFNLDSEYNLVKTDDFRYLNLKHVFGIRFGILDNKLYYDPTKDEEEVLDGCCTVLMSKDDEGSKLLKLSTTGTFILTEDIIAKMTATCSQKF